MSNMGVNDGHTVSGYGSGAVGRIAESEQTRLVGNEVRRLLKERGHNVVNCTIDYANSVHESLDVVVQQANREDLDWFISIHFNAGGGKGVEVYTYEGRQYEDAIKVCENIAALGFRNRGVKAGTGLYVIRKTKVKSMLIEVCFVDTDDADHYLQVGHTAIAEAIVNALSGYVSSKPSTPSPKPQPQPQGNDWIRRLQTECNAQGFSNQTVDGWAGNNTLNGCPLIRQGARGNITKLLQEKLNSLGYNCGYADGIFGGGTYNAVVRFQRDNGLGADGIVGRNTWKCLIYK